MAGSASWPAWIARVEKPGAGWSAAMRRSLLNQCGPGNLPMRQSRSLADDGVRTRSAAAPLRPVLDQVDPGDDVDHGHAVECQHARVAGQEQAIRLVELHPTSSWGSGRAMTSPTRTVAGSRSSCSKRASVTS